jgi:hypothetical protein
MRWNQMTDAQPSPPSFMKKYVDVLGTVAWMVSATFVCRRHALCQWREQDPDTTYMWCLIGSHSTKRSYQHLSCVVNIPVPVRCPFDKSSLL